MLAQYASFYKQINALPPEHRPPDDVIDDDDQLDRWYKTFVDDMARKAARMKATR
jgi:hypothetical protein